MENRLFSLVSTRTSWLTQRYSVLAQNLANADTPKFEAKDLKELDFKGLNRLAGNADNRLHLRRTHEAHVQGSPLPPLGALRAREIEAFEIAPGGNSVVIEEQVEKLADTQLDYQLMTNIYRKHAEMFRTALGRNG